MLRAGSRLGTTARMAALRLELNQSAAGCGRHSFGAAHNIEFAKNTFDVRFNGALADEQLGADLFVTLARCDALQHFDFASAQSFSTHAICQLGRKSWWNAGLTGIYFADAFHQRFASGVFQQVTFGAGLYCTINILIAIKCREHDNVSVWIEFADFFN